MRRYFQRLENCRHRPVWRALSRLGLDPDGPRLATAGCPPNAPCRGRCSRTGACSIRSSDSAREVLLGSSRPLRGDPAAGGRSGRPQRPAPAAQERGRTLLHAADAPTGTGASGTRERLLDVAQAPSRSAADRAARAGDARAVRCRQPRHRRRVPEGRAAVPRPSTTRRRHGRAADDPCRARGDSRRRRVQHAATADAVGHRAAATALEQHGIAVRVDLPGVGRNLQDRYEIGVVNRMSRPWRVLKGARFATDDRLFSEWSRHRTGMYASNGAALAVSLRSQPDRPLPDLFCMALLARFEGYFPGYSRDIADTSRLSHLGGAQGAHQQSRRRGHAALGRSARYAAGEFPLLRGRQRHDGRGPACRRGRGSASCAPMTARAEAAAA